MGCKSMQTKPRPCWPNTLRAARRSSRLSQPRLSWLSPLRAGSVGCRWLVAQTSPAGRNDDPPYRGLPGIQATRAKGSARQRFQRQGPRGMREMVWFVWWCRRRAARRLISGWVLGLAWVLTQVSAAHACQGDPGARCADGTYYIGQHSNGGALYAAGCDVGMVPQVNGSCTGERSLLPWGRTGSDSPLRNVTDLDAASRDFSGWESTATLVRSGSYPAAQACDRLSMNDHSDWYLPAMGELDLMWAATHTRAQASDDLPSWLRLRVSQSSGTALAQTFDRRIFASQSCADGGGFPCLVWSANEMNSRFAWHRFLSHGYRFWDGKNAKLAVRCVRRSTTQSFNPLVPL